MDTIALGLPPLPHYIAIGQTRYRPGEQHPNRRNLGLYDLLLVARGALRIGEDEREWTVTQGHTLLLRPDRYHYAAAPCGEETIFYWIHFEHEGKGRDDAGAGVDAVDRTDDPDAPLPMRHAWANPYRLKLPQYAVPRQFARIEQLCEQLLEHAGKPAAKAYWQEQQLFMELLRLLEEETASGGSTPTAVLKLAERTEAYLRAHYGADVTNETLAEALHFHPNYIVRCMKEIYRCTPMEYLQRYRFEQAKLLLIKTDWPVADIAERVGFRYAPYFSSCFKQQTGYSPLAFRKRHSV